MITPVFRRYQHVSEIRRVPHFAGFFDPLLDMMYMTSVEKVSLEL